MKSPSFELSGWQRFVFFWSWKDTSPLTFTDGLEEVTIYYCEDSGDGRIFAIYQGVILLAAPGLVMIVCYTYVIRELWISTRNMRVLTNTNTRYLRFNYSKNSLEIFKWGTSGPRVDRPMTQSCFVDLNRTRVVRSSNYFKGICISGRWMISERWEAQSWKKRHLWRAEIGADWRAAGIDLRILSLRRKTTANPDDSPPVLLCSFWSIVASNQYGRNWKPIRPSVSNQRHTSHGLLG